MCPPETATYVSMDCLRNTVVLELQANENRMEATLFAQQLDGEADSGNGDGTSALFAGDFTTTPAIAEGRS